MKKKIFSLALAVCMLAGCLAACNNGTGGGGGGGDKNGDWTNLDFKGQTLTVSVSANADDEVTFSAADKYTKGPDNAATSDNVLKKVLARNKKVADDLKMVIHYETTDLRYDEVLEHVEQLVAGDADDAPDVYNNDIYALTNAMLNGYLWNVTNPGLDAKGKEVKSYFEFDHECWYKEYMEGTSFAKDKLYMLVGDYNVDIIRFAWVFFVNIDLFDATYGSLSEEEWGYNSYESLCDYIADTGDWFYDDMIALADIGHNDAGGSAQGKTDKDDAQIGVCLNNLAPRIFIWGSGVSVYEWSKNGKESKPCVGTPALIPSTDIDPMVQLGNKYTELYNSKGVLPLAVVKDSTTMFMDGKIIMSMAELCVMESEQMRNTKFKRGILPFPRYHRDYTESVTTVVHDQAEIDTILNNAKSFDMASAYLQYVNELSMPILDMYYEEVLKFKYNDSKGARDMIDLVHDTIDSPFDSVMSAKVFAEKQFYAYFQEDAAANRDSTFSSKYGTFRDSVQVSLEEKFEKFEKLQ
ncbi:MAG: hypothetical protein J6W28_03555 [Clostridia bacterium]|nr:hypothetical protein [Clostridia bacterium]